MTTKQAIQAMINTGEISVKHGMALLALIALQYGIPVFIQFNNGNHYLLGRNNAYQACRQWELVWTGKDWKW